MAKKMTEKERLIKKIRKGKKLFSAWEMSVLTGMSIDAIWDRVKEGDFGFVVHRGLPYFMLDSLLKISPEYGQYVPTVVHRFFRPNIHYQEKNTTHIQKGGEK